MSSLRVLASLLALDNLALSSLTSFFVFSLSAFFRTAFAAFFCLAGLDHDRRRSILGCLSSGLGALRPIRRCFLGLICLDMLPELLDIILDVDGVVCDLKHNRY